MQNLQDLPELVLEYVLSYLKNEVCCRNKRELSVIVSNKYMYDFYNSHFKYTFYGFVDLKEFKKDLIFGSSKAPENYKFCLSPDKCNLLTYEDLYQLKDIMYRYESFKNNNFTIDRNLNGELRDYVLNTHSDTKQQLDNFIIKMERLKSNVWFYNNRCCDGCGSNIEIVKKSI